MGIVSCTALYCNALSCTALSCTALSCTALSCTALYCNALSCTALYCTALNCTALYCTLALQPLLAECHKYNFEMLCKPQHYWTQLIEQTLNLPFHLSATVAGNDLAESRDRFMTG